MKNETKTKKKRTLKKINKNKTKPYKTLLKR